MSAPQQQQPSTRFLVALTAALIALVAAVGALATTRSGGVSAAPYDDGQGGGGLNLGLHVGDDPQQVARNRALLAQHVPGHPAYTSQVHGIAVVDAALVQPGAPVRCARGSAQ